MPQKYGSEGKGITPYCSHTVYSAAMNPRIDSAEARIYFWNHSIPLRERKEIEQFGIEGDRPDAPVKYSTSNAV